MVATIGRHGKVGISGLVISFLGALPLGTLNITAFEIAASQGVNQAIWFSLAVIFVELIYVRMSLFGSKKLNFAHRWTYFLIAIAVAFLLYMSIVSFIASTSATSGSVESDLLVPKIASPLILGLVLSALNPLQIPFWMGWNKVLTAKKTLKNSVGSYSFYLSGIALGSMLGLLVFIFLGQYIFDSYAQYASIVNVFLGILYLAFSLYLLHFAYKKYHKPKVLN